MPSLATTSSRRDMLLLFGVCAMLPLILAACEILEVIQPAEAEQGEIIEVIVTIQKTFEDTNAWQGIVSVLVPEDWSLVSGAYDGDAGAGTMLESADWADSTNTVAPAPDGMKWIATISENASTASANDIYDVTLQLQVGQETGTFNLAYFTTITAFTTDDIDFGPPDDNTADILLDQPITVNMAVANEDETQPDAFALDQNFPNPFADATSIRYRLDRGAEVRLTVFDASGREVAVLAQGRQAAGDHTAAFDSADLPSGTYLYRLDADGETIETRQMTVVR
ncbi:MAG: T9SS type A sorting domain-containing protein [Bacteroidota bacterium]